MIRASRKEDAKEVVPLIDIVFEEMEIPQLMKLPKSQLYPVFEQAFLLKDYRYGYPNTYVHEDSQGQIDGILVGYPHELEAHIDDAFKPLLKKLGVPENQELFPDTETYTGEWYVDTLAVNAKKQDHGVGTKLLKGVEKVLKQRGVSEMSLNVDQQNPRAQKLYEKCGYEKNGELMIGSHRYNHMIKKID